MAAVTIDEIVQDALGVLGEVTGVGTQAYSEPRMIKDAGRAFNLLFKKRWWEQYSDWTTVVLDGVAGLATSNDFTQVLDFDDFYAVHAAGQPVGLPTLPNATNPSTFTGTSPRYWTGLRSSHANYVAKKIKVLPVTATGSLNIRARFHPLTVGQSWAGASIVHMDKDLLVYGTAFMALSGDSLNPEAKNDVQNMMDVRYKDIERSLSTQQTAMSGYRSGVPNQWHEV